MKEIKEGKEAEKVKGLQLKEETERLKTEVDQLKIQEQQNQERVNVLEKMEQDLILLREREVKLLEENLRLKERGKDKTKKQ